MPLANAKEKGARRECQFGADPRHKAGYNATFKARILTMPRDDMTIPSFAADRDEAVASAPRGAVPTRSPRAVASAGASGMTRLGLTIAFVVAAVACAWAFQLQTELDRADQDQAALATRVADLEALLSDTDESINKSAQNLGAQMRLLDSEVRKLWDARKVSNNSLDKLKKSTGSLEGRTKKLESASSTQSSAVASLKKDIAALKKVSGDLERLAKNAKQAQTDVERLADSVNKANLERASLNKRVAANEEWVQSINAFRKQINSSIADLEGRLRAMQSSPGTTPMQ